MSLASASQNTVRCSAACMWWIYDHRPCSFGCSVRELSAPSMALEATGDSLCAILVAAVRGPRPRTVVRTPGHAHWRSERRDPHLAAPRRRTGARPSASPRSRPTCVMRACPLMPRPHLPIRAPL
jgi:hypothetical protein